jgi:dienelactone hydrolase
MPEGTHALCSGSPFKGGMPWTLSKARQRHCCRARDGRLEGLSRPRLATGFALSVHPVSAEAIHTGASGLEAGEVKVPVADGSIPAYRAMPGKGGPFPTVLVVQEIFGVHEHIKDICRRLAKLGYFAIAPELYARQGNPAEISDIQELVAKIVSKVPDVEQMSDLDATVAFAKASGAADTSKLAITGLCRGGRTVWLYAAHNPAVKAAVSSYGHLELPSSELQPKSPIDLAADLKAPPRPLWRRRHRHQGRERREDKGSLQSCGQDLLARISQTRPVLQELAASHQFAVLPAVAEFH